VLLAMSLLRLVCEHFVAPSDDSRVRPHEGFVPPGEDPDGACAVSVPRTPPGVGLLCGPADAPAIGAALGLLLARRHRAAAVAVCVWTGGRPPAGAWRAPALPAARRLASGLVARGHDAIGAGRLATVRLPAACDDAATEARRAAAAAAAASAGGVPTVLALGGPRVAAFDALLAEQDLVVVATRSSAAPALARLAVEGLAADAVCACACEVPRAQQARALAEAGLMLLPSARRALAGPVGAMS